MKNPQKKYKLKRLLICGSGGQLGVSLKKILLTKKEFKVFYRNKKTLDVTKSNIVQKQIRLIKPDIIINASGYTNVDMAEKEKKKAYNVNVNGPKNLSIAAKKNNSLLIHISTDYVFSGKKNKPYKETDKANPISVYGKTKLLGEKEIFYFHDNFIIFRVSWLCGSDKTNFITKMLELGLVNKNLKIISDQIGRPTFTHDFSKVLFKIIKKYNFKKKYKDIYHYSSSGKELSWYEFAQKIFKFAKKYGYLKPNLIAISSRSFKSLAKRPKYSCLNINKALKEFKLSKVNLNESLQMTINQILSKKGY